MVDDDAVGVAAVGDPSQMLIGEVVGVGRIPAELFESGPARGAGPVGVDQAANPGKVAGLELGDSGANLGNATDDLMAGNAGIDGGHKVAPLVADLVKIGVADAAEKDFNLYVSFGRLATHDCGGSKPRCRAGGGVSFGVVHQVTSWPSRPMFEKRERLPCLTLPHNPKNRLGKALSGITILPICCLFLQALSFLCTQQLIQRYAEHGGAKRSSNGKTEGYKRRIPVTGG